MTKILKTPVLYTQIFRLDGENVDPWIEIFSYEPNRGLTCCYKNYVLDVSALTIPQLIWFWWTISVLSRRLKYKNGKNASWSLNH